MLRGRRHGPPQPVLPRSGQLSTARSQSPASLDRVGHPDQRIVRVDEQRHVVRLGIRVGIEGAPFVVEDLCPGVSVGASNGNAVQASGQYVRSGRYASDEGASGCGQGAVRAQLDRRDAAEEEVAPPPASELVAELFELVAAKVPDAQALVTSGRSFLRSSRQPA